MMTQSRTWCVLAVAGLMAGSLAACTSSPSATSSNGCPDSSGQVTLGFLGGFTGNESFLGPDMMLGVKAALAQINASGGILGCNVKVVTGDTANDPVDAVPAYRNMASKQVPVIIGPTSEGEAALPDMKRAKIPTFIQGGTTDLDKITGNPYFWRTTPSDAAQAAAMAYFALSKGWKKAAVAFTNDVGSTPVVAPLEAAFKKGGGTIVTTASLVPDGANYQSVVQQLVTAKPQVVFLQMDPQTAGTFFGEVQSAGFDNQTNWIGTNVEATSDVFKAIGVGPATTNLYMTNGVSQGGAALTTFTQWYKQANNTTIPANLSHEAYDGTIIAALAIDKAKSLSGESINNAILSVSSPPGEKVYSYAAGLKLIQGGHKINYEGVGSTDDFNQYHNVYGPFGVYTFDSKGNTPLGITVTAAEAATLGG